VEYEDSFAENEELAQAEYLRQKEQELEKLEQEEQITDC